MKKSLLICGLFATLLASCNKEQAILGGEPKTSEISAPTTLNEFKSAQELERAIKQSEEELRSARAYAYTEDGDGYCGMILHKQGFGK